MRALIRLGLLLTALAALARPARAEAQVDPAVKKQVDAMQAFYERTQSFEAHFDQIYTYASFHRVQKSSGKVVFSKPALMRWDYEKPNARTIVVAGKKVYMYDPEAAMLTVAPLDTDKLSASVTFLWGVGKLATEFDIRKAKRDDLPGEVLELTPKRPEPRFQRVYFALDPKSHAVKETIVVDPDGSENHMAFSAEKLNIQVGPERFHLSPPPGTEVTDLTLRK